MLQDGVGVADFLRPILSQGRGKGNRWLDRTLRDAASAFLCSQTQSRGQPLHGTPGRKVALASRLSGGVFRVESWAWAHAQRVASDAGRQVAYR